jgi:hypothetical protein
VEAVSRNFKKTTKVEREKNAFFDGFKANLRPRYQSDPFQANRKVVEQVQGYRLVPVGLK